MRVQDVPASDLRAGLNGQKTGINMFQSDKAVSRYDPQKRPPFYILMYFDCESAKESKKNTLNSLLNKLISHSHSACFECEGILCDCEGNNRATAKEYPPPAIQAGIVL